MVERKTVCLREEERGEYRDVALLQAPHFCQQWHLYLLNALLMPRHICCCKLLLRPILNDEEKETEMRVEVPWVIFNGDEKDFWHQFVLGVLLTLDHCFATFFPHGLHPSHFVYIFFLFFFTFHPSCLCCLCLIPFCHSYFSPQLVFVHPHISCSLLSLPYMLVEILS